MYEQDVGAVSHLTDVHEHNKVSADLMLNSLSCSSSYFHVFVLQARLYSLQADPATYCNEPGGK